MDQQQIYRDIAGRTEGDIYIGVVGPVRTGKSTFISRFMELLVLPNMEGQHRRERVVDELPQSGAGRTIMTTQPKFVPNEAVPVMLRDNASVNVRLVDCVGYLIRGALGTQEGEAPRMVRTPWYDHDIPFDQAAELGTRKVIAEHSTIGMVVTTDGSIADIPRTAYVESEERVVSELKALGKPFVIILNSRTPDTSDTQRLRDALSEKYDVTVLLTDVQNMQLEDVNTMLESVLFEFPLTEMRLDIPEWVGALDPDHYLISHLTGGARTAGAQMTRVRDHGAVMETFAQSPYVAGAQPSRIDLSDGSVTYRLPLKEGLFFQILGEESGAKVLGEAHLLRLMKELVVAKREYDRISSALTAVRETGYGLVSPIQEELQLEEPEIVRQGNRFGVRLRASAPSLHLIRVDIQTEVSPIVGTEKQSEELVKYLLSEFESDPAKIWGTNMFGKSLNELVREGLSNKLMRMPDDVRMKIQETLQRIINDGSGGMICILL